MKLIHHLILWGAAALISAIVVFYDSLPLPSGGLYWIEKKAPWFFSFPTTLGLFFSKSGVHSPSGWGIFLGFLLQVAILGYVVIGIVKLTKRL